MEYQIDTQPLPGPTLREMIEGLGVGQSLLAPNVSIKVLRVTASRVRRDHPERTFRVSAVTGAPRAWRVA